jgi:hypothetical protein
MKSRLFTKVFVVLTRLLSVAVPTPSPPSAPAVELFRYRYHADDGREFEYEYVFQTDEQNAPRTIRDEKAAEISAAWVTSFTTCKSVRLRLRNFWQGQ